MEALSGETLPSAQSGENACTHLPEAEAAGDTAPPREWRWGGLDLPTGSPWMVRVRVLFKFTCPSTNHSKAGRLLFPQETVLSFVFKSFSW